MQRVRAGAPAIFISYRSDDPGWAAYLDQRLRAAFGPHQVFRASRVIEAGDRFPERIRAAAADAAAMVVVIGTGWLGASDGSGRRAIDDPDDWVRHEVATALRAGRVVVPVLVDGAAMPRPADLPPEVRGLAERQFVRLTHKDDEAVTERLAKRLETVVPRAGSASPAPTGSAAAEAALGAALVRITGTDGTPAGLGVLVAPDLAVTSAHVVTAAAGGTAEGTADGTGAGPPTAPVTVDLPLAPPGADTARRATVEHWVPRGPDGRGDVAVLRLGSPPPGAVPVRLARDREVWGHPARVFGFPGRRPGGVWHSGVLRGGQADGLVQLDLAAGGYRVSPGFSGSPVWDDQLGAVVGIVTLAERAGPAAAFLVPADGLEAAWPPLAELSRPPSPFPGLSPFREADAGAFHARGPESDALAALLVTQPRVTLVGASGCGKSSLAMAGVIPRFRAAGGCAVVVRPASGSSPLAALAAALLPLLQPELDATGQLDRLPALTAALRDGFGDVAAALLERQGARRLLVVVDQLEELYALDAPTAAPFAEVVFGARLPDDVRVLATLRADRLGTALADPGTGPALAGRVEAVAPLPPARLREVVTAPVETVPGVRYEAGLVDRIVADAGTEAGALPLLSFTLDRLWRTQEGGRLTHGAYAGLGGVEGALGAHAERLWHQAVGPGEEETGRRLLLRLCREPDATAPASRNLVRRDDLTGAEWAIAERLAAGRLLVLDRDAEGRETVELAHEALIDGWRRLGAWVSAEAAFLGWRDLLRHDLARWDRAGRPAELLPTGATLTAAEGWTSTRGDWLTAAEREYVALGGARRRATARRRRTVGAVLAGALVVALVAAGLYVVQRGRSEEQAALAGSGALVQAAQRTAVTDAPLATLLAIAAYRRSPTPEAHDELLGHYLRLLPVSRVLSGDRMRTAAASHDGRVVVTLSHSGNVTVFTGVVSGRVRTAAVPTVAEARAVMVSADGGRIAVWRADRRPEVYTVDPGAPQLVGRGRLLSPGPPARLPESTTGPGTAVMSPDGQVIAALMPDRQVAWWNVDSGARGPLRTAPDGVLTPDSTEYPDPGRSLRPPGLWVGTGGGRPVLYATTGITNPGLAAIDLAGHAAPRIDASGERVSVSGDRNTAVVCSAGAARNTVSLTRVALRDGRRQGTATVTQEDVGCGDLAVNADGSRAALPVGLDGVVVLADTRTGAVASAGRLVSDQEAFADIVDRPGGTSLITAIGSRLDVTPFTSPAVAELTAAALRRDGRRFFALNGNGNGTELTDRTGLSGPALRSVRVPDGSPFALPTDLALSPDERQLAVRTGLGVRLFDTESLTPGHVLRPGAGTVSTFWFDGSGRLMTVADAEARLWDLGSGKPVARFDLRRIVGDGSGWRGPVVGAYPEPGRLAVAVPGARRIDVVDVPSGTVVGSMKSPPDVTAIRFDTTGRSAALQRRNGLVEVWRRSPDELDRVLGEVNTSAYPVLASTGPDTLLLAADGAVRVARAGSDRETTVYQFPDRFFDPWAGVSGSANFVAVSPDGSTVITDYLGLQEVVRFDPEVWIRELCSRVADRAFTADERADYAESLPTGSPCGGG